MLNRTGIHAGVKKYFSQSQVTKTKEYKVENYSKDEMEDKMVIKVIKHRPSLSGEG
ncbi:MAG TPA: hypothetical protein VK787_15800 [Puia sp.]|nr:hypothetical protein [Puia sp.]